MPARRTPRRTPKQRAGNSSSSAEERWGDRFRERLRLVVRDRFKNQAAFAQKVGVRDGLVSDWLAGRYLPGCEHLHAIGKATDISLDWLIFGDGGADPVYRSQGRTDKALQEDLRAFVTRALLVRAHAGEFALKDSVASRLLWSRAGLGEREHAARLVTLMLRDGGVAGDVASLDHVLDAAAAELRRRWDVLAPLMALALDFADSPERIKAVRARVKSAPLRTRFTRDVMELAADHERLLLQVFASLRQTAGRLPRGTRRGPA